MPARGVTPRRRAAKGLPSPEEVSPPPAALQQAMLQLIVGRRSAGCIYPARRLRPQHPGAPFHRRAGPASALEAFQRALSRRRPTPSASATFSASRMSSCRPRSRRASTSERRLPRRSGLPSDGREGRPMQARLALLPGPRAPWLGAQVRDRAAALTRSGEMTSSERKSGGRRAARRRGKRRRRASAIRRRPAQSRSAGAGGERIIVIDDNTAIHDDFRRILRPAEPSSRGAPALDTLEVELFGEPSVAREGTGRAVRVAAVGGPRAQGPDEGGLHPDRRGPASSSPGPRS